MIRIAEVGIGGIAIGPLIEELKRVAGLSEAAHGRAHKKSGIITTRATTVSAEIVGFLPPHLQATGPISINPLGPAPDDAEDGEVLTRGPQLMRG